MDLEMITRAHYKDRTNQNPEVQRGKAVTKVVEGIALSVPGKLFI